MSGQATATAPTRAMPQRAVIMVMPTMAEARLFRVVLHGETFGTFADTTPGRLRAEARQAELLFLGSREVRHWRRWQAARLVMRDRGVED